MSKMDKPEPGVSDSVSKAFEARELAADKKKGIKEDSKADKKEDAAMEKKEKQAGKKK